MLFGNDWVVGLLLGGCAVDLVNFDLTNFDLVDAHFTWRAAVPSVSEEQGLVCGFQQQR